MQTDKFRERHVILAKKYNTFPEVFHYIGSSNHHLGLNRIQLINRQIKKISDTNLHREDINKKLLITKSEKKKINHRINLKQTEQGLEKRQQILSFLQRINDEEFRDIINYPKGGEKK